LTKKNSRASSYSFASFIGIGILAFVIFFLSFSQFYFKQPLLPRDSQPINYFYAPGTSTNTLAEQLQQIGVIKHPRLLVLFLRVLGRDHQLRAGEYRLEPGMTMAQLVTKLVRGEVLQYPFTLVEGWSLHQIQQALTHDAVLNSTYTGLQFAGLVSGYPHPEGWFFPDTYYYVRGNSAIELLARAHQRMTSALIREGQERDVSVPYQHPYEALIVASLIEKETAVASERPLIAGVIVRRLNLNMPLQIDASVIYGMGDRFNGALTHEDVHRPSSYNTYVHHGLPPTPIANPSLASLHAALHPMQTTMLYYVAKGDGTHFFSADLATHEAAIARYQNPNQKKSLAQPK
jgi:UPF0755 protein